MDSVYSPIGPLRLLQLLAVTINTMPLPSIFDESDDLAEELMALIDVPLFDDSPRIRTSDIACSLSLEHWTSTRELLHSGLLSSAIVTHRAQFEALTRSIWLLYAASEDHLSKLITTLSLESEQAAKNMPQTAEMMQALATKAPPQAYDALSRFKENSWKALNSYAHAGIHPIRQHDDGYPVQLIHDVLRNANGLAVVSCMQAAVLSGRQPLQRNILATATKRPSCMPPPL
ncbi:DUF6988 family protein [Thauera sp.]|uniref:DUF6988 family protein n=1 Tax=Thauera sp. TaxID=1905334 RepID=UPI0039E286EB